MDTARKRYAKLTPVGRSKAGASRREFFHYSAMLGAAIAFAGPLAACGPQSTNGGSSSSGKDSIEASLAYSLTTGFDPMTSSSAVALAADHHVFEGLVNIDLHDRKAYPALAASLPAQTGPTTWEATLRDGATWHDGSAVTADDVVFTFSRILDPKNSSVMIQFLPFLDSVTALGSNKVRFNLKYPFGLFPSRVAAIKIVPKAIVTADQTKFDALPVGLGPFKLTSASATAGLTFAKYDKYNGPKPAKVKTMTWTLLTDASARVAALQSGRVQAIEAVPYANAAALSKNDSIGVKQTFNLLFLMFNCQSKPFDDVRVRQALHYALDKKTIINTALLGNATEASSFLDTTNAYYEKADTVYSYDPDKAKSLLAAAGVPSLSITLVTTDTSWVADCAPLIKQSWDAIGVQTTLNIGQSGGQYKNFVTTGKYQVMVAPGDPSVWGPNDPDLLMRWWYNGLWPTTYYRWSETPEASQVVALLDQAARATSDADRKPLWRQAINIVAAQAPLYPLFHIKLDTGWNPKALTNFAPIETTGLSFLDVGRS